MPKSGNIKEFLLKYEYKIVLLIGFILISVISFEAGFLKGENWKQKPLVIEKIAQSDITPETVQNTVKTQDLGLKTDNKPANQPQKDCAYVGSKNSNKYHVPTCTWAKQIKPENIVCFSSVEDAVAKGYQPGCLK